MISFCFPHILCCALCLTHNTCSGSGVILSTPISVCNLQTSCTCVTKYINTIICLIVGGRASNFHDYVNDGRTPGTDCDGHGTHVAGTAAGTKYGVAKLANIFCVRTLACDGSGYDSDIIEGINKIVASGAKPAVINL